MDFLAMNLAHTRGHRGLTWVMREDVAGMVGLWHVGLAQGVGAAGGRGQDGGGSCKYNHAWSGWGG